MKDKGLANDEKVNGLTVKYLQERKELLEFAQSCNVGSFEDWRTDSVLGLDTALRSKLTYQAVLDGYSQAEITHALSPEFDVAEVGTSPTNSKPALRNRRKRWTKGAASSKTTTIKFTYRPSNSSSWT
ncbi:MAG: hypothetical protein ACLSAP_05285 [Oscillospiraceae bacterium]